MGLLCQCVPTKLSPLSNQGATPCFCGSNGGGTLSSWWRVGKQAPQYKVSTSKRTRSGDHSPLMLGPSRIRSFILFLFLRTKHLKKQSLDIPKHIISIMHRIGLRHSSSRISFADWMNVYDVNTSTTHG